jgi:hypothetical protein
VAFPSQHPAASERCRQAISAKETVSDTCLSSVQPDLRNLEQLCQEDGIDFLLLTHEFPGLVTAGNGHIFIYDCRQVRAALTLSSPTTAATLRGFPVGTLSPLTLSGPAPNLPSIERRKIYDTTQPGLGNGGHTFGDDSTEEERAQVIEYLKSL